MSELTTVLESIQGQLNSAPSSGSSRGFTGSAEVDNVIVDMSTDGGQQATPESAPHQSRPSAPGPGGPTAPDNPAASGPGSPTEIIRQYLQSQSTSIVFLLIILLDVIYTHRLGVLVILALAGSWYHASSLLTEQISLRANIRNQKQFYGKLVWCIAVACVNIACLYIFFNEDNELSNRFIFLYDHIEDLWTLFWIVILNDFTVKFASTIIKCLVTLLPQSAMTYQRKGSLYCAVERVSIFYRSLITIVPWYSFLFDRDSGVLFYATLFILYSVFKFLGLWKQLEPLYLSIKRLGNNTIYGVTPTDSELQEAGEVCAVCHDEYTNPVMLTCKHTFCEECIGDWFDREQTCPMCRAKVSTKDPAFRDGSGQLAVQFY